MTGRFVRRDAEMPRRPNGLQSSTAGLVRPLQATKRAGPAVGKVTVAVCFLALESREENMRLRVDAAFREWIVVGTRGALRASTAYALRASSVN